MIKLLNIIFNFLKFVLFFISLGLTLYIIMVMYARLDKSMVASINIFIPFLLLLICFCLNMFFRQSMINHNIFYNVTCFLVFSTICVVNIRTIWDYNMVLNEIMGYNINFSYFSDFLVFMKIMLYGLVISNIIFMLYDFLNTDKKTYKSIDNGVEVL